MSLDSTMNSHNGAVVTVACAITFIVTLIVTAIITFVVTYIFVKKTLTSIPQDTNHATGKRNHTTGKYPLTATNTIIYDEPVGPLNRKKDNLELQPNPAYGTSHEVTMSTNPAYKSCK